MKSQKDRNRRRAFGQNFLIDNEIINKLITDIDCTENDWLIEIGPGQGALTRPLLGKCQNISVIEIDKKWVSYLGSRKDFSPLSIIQGDASTIDVDNLFKNKQDSDNPSDSKPILVGNLPYNRAGPILNNFVPRISDFKYQYFMVQYEVAKRITASPHSRSFGALSVFIQNYAKTSLAQKIPPDAFKPRPKIFSATVRLEALPQPLIDNPHFFPFVHTAFAQKRKKLVNVLSSSFKKDELIKHLQQIGQQENCRAEDLSVEDFAKLFKALNVE
ncbi:MAG: ribosomal RNA small subunit methyltransferase A [Fibrobacteria bacterium]|nr:ribosomal RNA small subunit methyltransferase A [Fibrobacteria bacterium]